MKKILFIGKMNSIVKEISEALSAQFRVQLCTDNREAVSGMFRIFQPDLVLISLIGMSEVDTGLFLELSEEHRELSVVTIGTETERDRFLKFYEDDQFENLIRPVSISTVKDTVCRKLGVEAGSSEDRENESDKKKILVVDDEVATLRSIKGMLEDEYEVFVANSGAKAMTMIGKKNPDLVLLDYEMPVCDGRQTLEMIRSEEELKDMPVIFLTSVNDREHIEAVLKLKPTGYLLKPAVKQRLLEAVRNAIL